MSSVVNTAIYLKSEVLLDTSGVPVTTKVNGDWTKTARLLGSGTTATPTITHHASGVYDVTFTPTTVGNWSVEYSVVVNGDTVIFDPQYVQVVTAAQSDPASVITANVVNVTGPVSDDNVITLVRGTDYLNADGRAVSFTVSSPDLTGATVTLRIYTYANVTALSKAMTVSGTTVRVDLTHTETAALSLGTPAYKFTVTAVLVDASTVRPVSGTVWVSD